MTHEELSSYLENNPQVLWTFDEEGNLYLRHELFDKLHEKIRIEPKALEKLTAQKLENVLVGGRNVEHITRVTGYFSRVSGWTTGKRGELVDRERVEIN